MCKAEKLPILRLHILTIYSSYKKMYCGIDEIIGGVTLDLRKTSDFELRLGQNMGNLSGTTASDCPHSNDRCQCNQASLLHHRQASHELEAEQQAADNVQSSIFNMFNQEVIQEILTSCDRFSAMQVLSESDFRFANPQTLSAILQNIQASTFEIKHPNVGACCAGPKSKRD